MNYEAQERPIRNLVDALKALREGGVTSNKTDLTCQISEWLVKEIFNGTLASTSINKDWDLMVGEKRVQVKAHAKAATNKNRKTYISYNEAALIDELIIVVFTQDYALREFYCIPWSKALQLISHNKGGSILSWSRLNEYQLDIESLPNQPVISLFK